MNSIIKMNEKKPRYAMRKLCIGFISCLLGFTMIVEPAVGMRSIVPISYAQDSDDLLTLQTQYEGKIIHVSNNLGTQANSYNSLSMALKNAQDGDIIQLDSNILENIESGLTIDKRVKILGNNKELVIRADKGAKIVIDENITIENINLSSRIESHGEFPILVRSSYFKMNNVWLTNGNVGDTFSLVVNPNRSNDVSKIIITGSKKIDFDKIEIGENNTPLESNIKVLLDNNVSSKAGVIVKDYIQNSDTSHFPVIINKSQITRFISERREDDSVLIFDGVNKNIFLKKIKNVKLKNKSSIALEDDNLDISNTIFNLPMDTTLNLSNLENDSSIESIVVDPNTIAGTIIESANKNLTITGNFEPTTKIRVENVNYASYFTLTLSNPLMNDKLPDIELFEGNTKIIREGGVYKATVGRSEDEDISESEDSSDSEESLENESQPGDKGTIETEEPSKGDESLETEEPSKGDESSKTEETSKGDESSETEKPSKQEDGVKPGEVSEGSSNVNQGEVIISPSNQLLGNFVQKNPENENKKRKFIVSRIDGKDRIATAINVAKKLYPSGAKRIILVNKSAYTDSLSALVLSNALNAPILYTYFNSTPNIVVDEIKNLGVKEIVIIGGSNSISDKQAIELHSRGLDVERISGKDRFDTAVKVSEKLLKLGIKNTEEVVIASEESFPDALAISSFSVERNIPVFLVKKERIPEDINIQISKMKNPKIYIVGGKNTISEAVENQLNKMTKKHLTRLAGNDRYETSMIVSNFAKPNAINGVIANGERFEDVLIAGSLASNSNTILLLGTSQYLSPRLDKYLQKSKVEKIHLVGGINSLGVDYSYRLTDNK